MGRRSRVLRGLWLQALAAGSAASAGERKATEGSRDRSDAEGGWGCEFGIDGEAQARGVGEEWGGWLGGVEEGTKRADATMLIRFRCEWVPAEQGATALMAVRNMRGKTRARSMKGRGWWMVRAAAAAPERNAADSPRPEIFAATSSAQSRSLQKTIAWSNAILSRRLRSALSLRGFRLPLTWADAAGVCRQHISRECRS